MLKRKVYGMYRHGKHAHVTSLALTMLATVHDHARIENNSQVLSIELIGI